MKRRRRKDAEEDEREEFARDRRERARRARGGLGAKVAGESGEGEISGEAEPEAKSKSAGKSKSDAKSKPEAKSKSKSEAKSKPEAKSKSKAKAKPEPTVTERRAQRERLRASKATADERKETKDGEKPKAAKKSRDEKDKKGAKPVAGRRGGKATAGKTGSKPARKRGAAAKRTGAGALTALKQGAGETRTRIRKAAPKAANGAVKLLVWAFGIFFIGFGFVLRLLIAAYLFAYGPVRTALLLARRGLQAVSRQVTPVRALALVVAGAAVLLALSQFADYRTITIGNDAYAPGIQTVAPPPVAETADTGSAHSYLMVPLAVISLIVLGAALTGRWRLCRLIALVGLVAIAVGLIHDRPTGLDPGSEAVAYTGVKATLVGGFYAQIFSGLLLTLSSLLLGRELKLAGSRRPARASRGSRSRRKLLRRNPRVEGARA